MLFNTSRIYVSNKGGLTISIILPAELIHKKDDLKK